MREGASERKTAADLWLSGTSVLDAVCVPSVFYSIAFFWWDSARCKNARVEKGALNAGKAWITFARLGPGVAFQPAQEGLISHCVSSNKEDSAASQF
jgi:hypothetical protein